MIIISTKLVPKAEQHSHAHSLLTRCLKGAGIDYTAGQTPVILGEHGKPSLSQYPEIHFNISHSDGIAAAMTSECECGIDCERIREFSPRIMKRCFSETERAAVESAPESERELMFFSLWTLKEAYVKALGAGLTFSLKNAEFTIKGDEISTNLEGCTFERYVVDGKFVVSVCKLTHDNAAHKSHRLQSTNDTVIIDQILF